LVILRKKPTEIWEDNASCILMSENPTDRDQSRHVDVKVHYLRDHVGKHSLSTPVHTHTNKKKHMPEEHMRKAGEIGGVPGVSVNPPLLLELEEE
jgi:hypothetical protein